MSLSSSSSLTLDQDLPTSASRLMTSMRRSLSYSSSKKPPLDATHNGMYSTPEERTAFAPAHFRFPDPASTRPTIEQIAMGLHISRTPHLRPVAKHHRHSAPTSQEARHKPRHAPHRSPPPLPPAPARSSLKKTRASSTGTATPPARLSASSQSTLTVTSLGPSTPRSGSSLKLRLARLFPGSLSSSPSSSGINTPTSVASDPGTPRKAVRFSIDETAPPPQ